MQLIFRYKQKRLLHGIIYMHRISDNRMSGTATRNLHFFQDLCGTDALMNAIIVTNMWGLVDSAVGNAREQELKSKDAFFKPAVSAGTKVLRHDNTASSAHRIVREMLHNTPRPFRLQRELVDEGRRVFETAAGETLLQELAQLEQRHAQEMRELEAEFQDAVKRKDEEARQEIEEAQRKVETEQAKLAEQKKRLMEFQLLEAQLMQSEAEARAGAGPGRESEDLQRKLLTAQHAEDDEEAGGERKRPPPSFFARLLHGAMLIPGVRRILPLLTYCLRKLKALCPCFGFLR